MKKLDQNGIATAPVFVLAVLLAVVGIVGWRVYTGQQNMDITQMQKVEEDRAKEEPKTEPNENLAKYTHPVLNFSVSYPDNWTNNSAKPFTDDGYENFTVLSPDYIFVRDDAYGEVREGMAFKIICNNINEKLPTVEEILADNTPSPSVYDSISEVRQTEVGGTIAVTYINSYEGPETLVTEFNLDNVSCRVQNYQSIDNSAEYKNFVNSIEISKV